MNVIVEKKSYWQRFVASLQSTSKRERIGIGLLTFLVLLIVVVVIIITTQISNIGDSAENTTPGTVLHKIILQESVTLK